jgi:hypothetical protein
VQAGGPNPFQGKPPMVQQAPQPGQAQINAYLRISPALLAQITAHVQRLPNGATPAQQFTAMQRLFTVLRSGGTLGLHWNASTGRTPRSPDDVLRSRGGDCDELSTTFYAAARALNINVGAMRLTTMELRGGGYSVRHAPLLLSSGGRRYIVDPIMPGIVQVPDFSDATLRRTLGPYFGLGGSGPVPNLAAITLHDRQDFTSAAQIASVELLERVQYNAGLKTAAGRRDAELDLRAVVAIGQTHAFIVRSRDNAAQNLFHQHFSIADKAFTAGGRGNAVVQGYLRALAIISLVPTIRTANSNAIYRANGGLGLCYQSMGRHADAGRMFANQMALDPRNAKGYENAYNLAIRLAKSAKGSASTRAHLNDAYRIARRAVRNLPAGKARTGFQDQLGELARVYRARHWPTP